MKREEREFASAAKEPRREKRPGARNGGGEREEEAEGRARRRSHSLSLSLFLLRATLQLCVVPASEGGELALKAQARDGGRRTDGRQGTEAEIAAALPLPPLPPTSAV